ncbi:MAG: hypothetical protein GEU80_02975 [Dehalococcoidia bacterium]|nr:hypothetical protein [Dehalococcoidia bacterium]
MTQDTPLLFPYTTTPPRIADELIAALRGVEGVTAISLFGSLATGTHDGFSDIDLMVGYEGGADIEWAASAAIDRAKPVRFYRAFSDMAQPSGRRWFDGESPFHHADVSFRPMPLHERVRVEGVREGYPVTSVEVFRREACAPQSSGSPGPVGPLLDIGDLEREAGGGAYLLLRAAKEYLRGRSDEPAWDEAYRTFLGRVRGATVTRRFAGGRLGELVQECLELKMAIDRAGQG